MNLLNTKTNKIHISAKDLDPSVPENLPGCQYLFTIRNYKLIDLEEVPDGATYCQRCFPYVSDREQ